MATKYLHIIPPDVAKAYQIVKFMTENFPECEHSFLIMQTKNWVIKNRPRLLAFLHLKYLPEVTKSPFSILMRLKSTLGQIREADHIVLHSIFCIKGKLFLPFFCRRRYAQKCIWIEMYSDLIRWRHSGAGIKVRIRNALLGNFIRNIPLVGCTLLDDKIAYDQHVKGKAKFILAPLPLLKTDQELALKCMEAHELDKRSLTGSDYREFLDKCDCLGTEDKAYGNEQLHTIINSSTGVEGHGHIADHFKFEATFDVRKFSKKRNQMSYSKEKIGRCHMIMVEGDMFEPQDHLSLFNDFKHLTDEGIIVANLNHVGKHCYSGSEGYRRLMYRCGTKVLGNKYVDYRKPTASKKYFFERISTVDAIVFFSMRTMNMDLIWTMLLMNKKVFLPAQSWVYGELQRNGVPVYSCEALKGMDREQLISPIKTNSCEWIQKFIDNKQAADCWNVLFEEAEHCQSEGRC